MNKAPAFQFYAQDFLTGVMYLTNEEIGIYIKMLAKQWTDGKIPKKRLGFLVGLDWDNLSDELKSKFKDCGEYIVNTRLEKEREKKNNFLKRQSENGKKGGRGNKKEENNKATINPNKSQKKPLEDEDEIEEEKEDVIENKKKQKQISEIEVYDALILPFEDEYFEQQWNQWKVYKKDEFRFKYKSLQSEQAALNKLNEISNNDVKKAIEIINNSMSNGWKGFFQLDTKTNQKNNYNNNTSAFEILKQRHLS